MDIDLRGKRAVVCGASKGIGRAAATELAACGASVTLLSRHIEALEEVRDGLAASGDQAHHVLAVDFLDTDDLKDNIDAYIADMGPVHILVNNSGGPPAGPAHTAHVGDFVRAFTQHLLGGHIMMQAVLPSMKSEGYGRIINVISTSVKQPITGLGVSNTIRGAVANWAKTLAGELGPMGITVNNVLPGATDTERLAEIMQGKADKAGKTLEEVLEAQKHGIPMRRFADPSETGQAIAFLASPAAGYINGINLPVDGGRTGCL